MSDSFNNLLILDSSFSEAELQRLEFARTDKLFVFPLTSQVSLIKQAIEKIKHMEPAPLDIEILDTAVLINSLAEDVRSKFMRFISELPNRDICNGKSIKEIFALDKHATLWWLSLVAEKNTCKTDGFNTLVQLHAITKAIKSNTIKRIIIGCSNYRLKDSLFEYAKGNNVKYRALRIKKKGGFSNILKYRLKKFPFLRHFALLVYNGTSYFLSSRRIKKTMKRASVPVFPEDALMCITYYPNFDLSLAARGILRHKHYSSLQDWFESQNKEIIWIAMNVPNDGIGFEESLKYAKSFVDNKYNLFFLEEFCSLSMQLKAFFGLIRDFLVFLRIEKDIKKQHILDDFNFYSILKDEWYSTFIGSTGYSGILYYYTFRKLLDDFRVRKCLYFFEMHAWEKALIMARNSSGSKTTMFAYQPGTVSRMLLNYFNLPEETAGYGGYLLPLPDKILCNGNIPYRYMKSSCWRGAEPRVVEAIKYNYLKEYLSSEHKKEKDIILLALSINLNESISILTAAIEGLSDLKDIEVWIRPHPFLQLKQVFDFMGLSEKKLSFKISTGRLEEALSAAKVVIGGESGVCVEAIAFGCDLVVVNLPEWINMSPFLGLNSSRIHFVNSLIELREAVMGICREKQDFFYVNTETKRILNDFFYLNDETNVPERFIKAIYEEQLFPEVIS